MKLYYYADTDSRYIDLANRPSAASREVLPGVVLDLDDRGALVGIDIDHASGPGPSLSVAIKLGSLFP